MPTITVARVATQFLERNQLEKPTRTTYEFALAPFLQKYGYWSISTLDRSEIKDYLDSLKGIKYTTHNKIQRVLNALFNYALSEGYIDANPMQRLPKRKPDRERGEHRSDEVVRYLTPEQLDILYQVVDDNPRLAAIVSLLHRTGARIDELLSLDLDQIDRDNRRFQVLGKGNKQRWCFYSLDAAQALQRYLRYYRHKGHPALFTARHPTTGEVTRASYDIIYEDWVKARAQHPTLKGIRLHDLRHTFGTERGGLMGVEELRALMGHSSIQTTLLYQKITSSRAEQVAHKALQALTTTAEESDSELL